MEVELLQDVVDQIGLLAMLVDPIERVTSRLDRQRRDLQNLAARRNREVARGDTKADFPEPTQFLHHVVDLLTACSLRIEDGFGVIEDYDHLI